MQAYNAVPLPAWWLANWQEAKALVSLAICLGLLLARSSGGAERSHAFFIVFFFVALAPTSISLS